MRRAFYMLPLMLAAAMAQVSPISQPTVAPPVSYASMSQLNQFLAQLEQTRQMTQGDLAKLRVERWKTDSSTKRQVQGNVDSIQRNLQDALPEIVAQLRSSPESLSSTFKLYRNLSALYDVFSSVVESAGAFGSKDEFQSLENDLTSLDQARRSFGERMETITGAREAELARLRTQVQQQAEPAKPTKKVIVDDELPKKPVKKKPAPKPGTAAPTTQSKSDSGKAPAPPQ